MTASREDYLKAIYDAGGIWKKVSTTTVAKALRIASASVTEMAVRLSHEGLVSYEPYKGVQLTEKGLSACINVVRSHELWEVFLVEYLGYSLSQSHAEAEALEHATSPMLAERLDEFLRHPETCPHGGLIPRPGVMPEKREMEKLSECGECDEAVIVRIEEEKELLEYLDKMSIKAGDRIEVISYGEYECPVTIKCGDRLIMLSRKAAERIFVSVCRGGE